MSTVYRPGASRALAGAIAAISVLGLVALTFDEGISGLIRYGWWIVLPAVLAWAIFWNPRIVVDDAGVQLVNVFRSIRLPWPAIQAVDTKWALKLVTSYGSFAAWAAPAPGRHGSREISAQEVKHLPALSYGVGDSVRPGDAVNTPSGQAAIAIRQHWQALHDAGYLDDPRLEFDRPPIRWHLGILGTIGGLIALGMAGLLL
jgi:Bacterial PH domain